MSLTVEVIDNRERFAAVAEPWNDLVARATLRNSFHRHEWYRCWLAEIAPEARPRIVTLAREGRLVAAAPLHVAPTQRSGVAFEMLSFLQSGITPRSGLLVESDDLCEPLLDAIDAIPGWQLAELKAMELDHPTTRRFADLLGRRGAVVAEAGMVSPYEELPDSWEEYYQARTNKIRQRFRSAINRTHKQHERVEVRRLETREDLTRHFDSLLAVSAASWKGTEGTDMATVDRAAAFYRAYSESTADQGAWIAYLLLLDGSPAAFMYLLRDGSHWVALRSDYDEAFSYVMPGVLLHKEVITDLCGQPAPRIYDLVGTATHFKSNLAREGRRLCDLTFGGRGLRGRALMQGKLLLGKRADSRHLDLDQVVGGTVPASSDDERAPGSKPDQG